MAAHNPLTWLALIGLCGLAVASALDLRNVEQGTLVVYTTSALQEFLEKSAIPMFKERTGRNVIAIYVAAGEEYYRVRLSPERPEADVFLHASPLYLEKGYADGLFSSFDVPGFTPTADRSSRPVEGGHLWSAFAWSPLVEVYHPSLASPPDFATTDAKLGLAHPRISNNGVYSTVLFEAVDPQAGAHAVAQSVVQPTNARATIGGVADRSYAATLGYEAVARFYQGRGAKIAYAAPVVGGQNVTTPVLMSAALVAHHPHAGALEFIQSLFRPDVQATLPKYGLRGVTPDAAPPDGALDLGGVRVVAYDWAQWAMLEAALPRYEVRS